MLCSLKVAQRGETKICSETQLGARHCVQSNKMGTEHTKQENSHVMEGVRAQLVLQIYLLTLKVTFQKKKIA